MCPSTPGPSDSTGAADDTPTQAVPTTDPAASDPSQAESSASDDQPTQAIPQVQREDDPRTTRIPQMERSASDPDPMTTPIPELRSDERRQDGPRFAEPADPTATRAQRYEAAAPPPGAAPHHDWDARAAYGGMNIGAALYGWLTAVGLTSVLVAVAGVVVGLTVDSSGSALDSIGNAVGDAGLVSAVVGGVIVLVCAFVGGYVAGRMSRFDGGRQGVGVWVFFVLSAVAVVVGLVVVMGRFDTPSSLTWLDTASSPSQWASQVWIGIAAGVVVALLASVLGAKAGHRYHTKVDRMLDTRFDPGYGARG